MQRFSRFSLYCTVFVLSACGRSPLEDWQTELLGQGPGTSTGTESTTTTTTTDGSGGSGGAPVDCTAPQECVDEDACTTDTCESGKCVHVDRDDDGDGFSPASCGGNDCNDLNPNVFPGHEEVCNDGSDNDCNGVSDCFDPACGGVENCGCVPQFESCSNNVDDDCDGVVDCFDADCAGTEACGCANNETSCENGFDDDCDGQFDCDDSDCKGTEICLCQTAVESCGNGKDEDCDLLIDCADPDCEGKGQCGCVPEPQEDCTDGFDNDCDGLPDCADTDCVLSDACKTCTEEVCDDGIDNNCDLKIDCADPACAFADNCEPEIEVCNNQLDDDHDSLTDCADPDCSNNPICVQKQSNCDTAKLIGGSGTYTGDTTNNIGETKGTCGGGSGEAVFYFVLSDPSKVHLDTVGTTQFDSTLYVRAGSCESGKEIGCDDDSGGSWAASLDFTILYPGTYYVFVDGYTNDEGDWKNQGPFVLNVDIVPNPPELCSDGLDNDGDVYVDCADPDCSSTAPCSTCLNGSPGKPEFGAFACTDGLDDDCDGVKDCDDPDCSASDYYVNECCNGADDNGNMVIDDFNCRCNNSSECPSGQICYTHSSYTCGPPCDQFMGEICPYVAAGSACNSATGQCEF